MTIDPKIREAIEAAVKEAGQSQGLARRLARWFEAVASGSENINDRQSAARHLELLYEETEVSEGALDINLDELLAGLDESEGAS
jgi:hypothetical protein